MDATLRPAIIHFPSTLNISRPAAHKRQHTSALALALCLICRTLALANWLAGRRTNRRPIAPPNLQVHLGIRSQPQSLRRDRFTDRRPRRVEGGPFAHLALVVVQSPGATTCPHGRLCPPSGPAGHAAAAASRREAQRKLVTPLAMWEQHTAGRRWALLQEGKRPSTGERPDSYERSPAVT
jgi:hypothetical protein